MGTLSQMGTQREQLQIASDNMQETLNLTDQARAVMQQM